MRITSQCPYRRQTVVFTLAVTAPAYISRLLMGTDDIDIPRRVKLEMNDRLPDRDISFSKFAADHKVEYISIIDILCDAEGCIVRVPYDESHDDVTQWDLFHLSVPGSRFVADTIAPILLGPH